MCGIAGIWHLDQNRPVSPGLVRQMTSILSHRGPDDEGYLFVNTATGCLEERHGEHTVPQLQMPDIRHMNGESFYNLAFGFRRLSIIDVSPAGHQPMSNADGSLWIVFNGEIYNYVELRKDLEAKGHTFKTVTDTEVILCAYAEWGKGCLEHFNGMWAFAIWDNRQRRLFCARDRFGIKPFYYAWDGETFAFASEIKALLQLPYIARQPNDAIVYDYLHSGGLDRTDETFFNDISQISPGHQLTLSNSGLKIDCYWDLDPHHRADPVMDESFYEQKFYELFEDSVRIHLRSDVPIGTCLSGGLDSSAIVTVANKLLFADGITNLELVGDQQKTFSACYDDKRFDEREYIEPILSATGAEQNYTFPSAAKLVEDIPRLIWHHDEPFLSTSIFAQWSVMEVVASRGVKVLLDGQGGDELLAGYHPCFDYFWGGLARQGRWLELWHELSAYRDLFGKSIPYLALRGMRPFAPAALQSLMRRRLNMGGALGLNADFSRAFDRQNSEFVYRDRDPLHDYLYSLTRYGLPRLLRFEDRNSMAHSIEARVPFLDHRLVEYLFSLPAEQKIKRGLTKVVLRNAFKGIMPDSVRLRTSKMGFVTPEATWLATELKDWVYEVIGSESFRSRGYFDVPQIIKVVNDHMAGRRDASKIAWRWLNLELWLRQTIDQSDVLAL